jgi:integrase
LDIERVETSSPLLAGGGLISLEEAARAIGLPTASLLGELLNDRAAVVTMAQNWRGWVVPDIRAIDRDFDGAFMLDDAKEQGSETVFSGLVRAFNSVQTLAALGSAGRSAESVFRLAGERGFWPDDVVEVPLGAWMAQKGAVERVRSRLAAALSPEQRKRASASAKASINHDASGGVVVFDRITAKHGDKRFSELFDLCRSHRRWGAVQLQRMNTEAGLFIGLMDDPTLTSIEVETIHEFARLLSKLPRDVYQSSRKFKVKSVRDLIGIAQRESLPTKNDNTVRGHVGRVAEVLNFGVSKGMLHANPAAGFKREWGVAKKGRAQDERDPFSPDELQLIFAQDWFLNGRGSDRNWRPHYFWLPLLALLSGGRLNELAQLYLDDVCQSVEDKSVWYLDFNLNQPDKLDADDADSAPDKSLKTVNSIRVVPLHKVIVAAGLPAYIAALRRAGHDRLFPELKRDDKKGYGKPAGSWFNERLLGRRLAIERNGRKTFHSFRHNFATALERLDQAERVQAQLLGHERGRTQSGSRYAKDRGAAEVDPVIAGLDFPCLKQLAKFDVAAGLKAIGVAVRLKESFSARAAKL